MKVRNALPTDSFLFRIMSSKLYRKYKNISPITSPCTPLCKQTKTSGCRCFWRSVCCGRAKTGCHIAWQKLLSKVVRTPVLSSFTCLKNKTLKTENIFLGTDSRLCVIDALCHFQPRIGRFPKSLHLHQQIEKLIFRTKVQFCAFVNFLSCICSCTQGWCQQSFRCLDILEILVVPS